jgi:hypothetical protein
VQMSILLHSIFGQPIFKDLDFVQRNKGLHAPILTLLNRQYHILNIDHATVHMDDAQGNGARVIGTCDCRNRSQRQIRRKYTEWYFGQTEIVGCCSGPSRYFLRAMFFMSLNV